MYFFFSFEFIISVVIIKLEDFYRPLTDREQTHVTQGEYNFDHPDAMDFKLVETAIVALLSGQPFQLPKWDFTTHVRVSKHDSTSSSSSSSSSTSTAEPNPQSTTTTTTTKTTATTTTTVYRPDVVIFEGNLMLYKKRVRDAFDLKVFVDVEGETRLSKQVIRDTEQRYKKSLEEVLHQYMKFVKPSFEDFILPVSVSFLLLLLLLLLLFLFLFLFFFVFFYGFFDMID
jgi:uridine kinase